MRTLRLLFFGRRPLGWYRRQAERYKRFVPALLVFITLHGPDGSKVLVNPDSIATIRDADPRLYPGAHSVINAGGPLAVVETPADIARLAITSKSVKGGCTRTVPETPQNRVETAYGAD